MARDSAPLFAGTRNTTITAGFQMQSVNLLCMVTRDTTYGLLVHQLSGFIYTEGYSYGLKVFIYQLLVELAIDWLSSKLPLWPDSVLSAHTILWLQRVPRSLPWGAQPYPLQQRSEKDR